MSEISILLLFYGILWVVWILGSLFISKLRIESSDLSFLRFPGISGFSISLMPLLFLFVGFGVAFRIVSFFIHPILDDDWARFLWDGKIFHDIGSPYSTIPMDWFGRDWGERDWGERENWVLSHINHPEYSTIYLPTLQYLFVMGYWIAGLEFWGLRFLYLVFDLGILIYLLRIHRDIQKHHSLPIDFPYSLILTYLWGFSPLWIWEFFIHIHPDIVGIFFLLAGYFYYSRNQFYRSGVLWGLSLGSKPVLPILLILIGIFKIRDSKYKFAEWKGFLSSSIISLVVFLLIWIPFLGYELNLTTVFGFLNSFEFNSSIYAILKAIHPQIALVLSPILYFCFLVGILLLLNPEESIDFFCMGIAGVFLYSSVANPWYLLWSFPFLYLSWTNYICNKERIFTDEIPFVIPVNLWVLMWSLTIVLSYCTGQNLGVQELGVYDHPFWVRPLEFLPVFIILILGIVFRRRTKHRCRA